MKIIFNSSYKNTLRSLKKRYQEKDILDKVIKHIINSSDRHELQSNPISYLYGFEPLKYDLKNQYSFNLNKNRGRVRVIFQFVDDYTVELLYISIEHYKDYKKIKK